MSSITKPHRSRNARRRADYPTPVDRICQIAGHINFDDPALDQVFDRLLAGDPSAESELLKWYGPMVWRIAAGMKKRQPGLFSDSLDELVSDGLVGLFQTMRAADRGGRAFGFYAVKRIRSSIRRNQMRRLGLPVRGESTMRRARVDFIQDNGRLPTDEETLLMLGAAINNPNIQIGDRPKTFSYSAPFADGKSVDPADTKSEPIDQKMIDRETIELAMKGLDARDRELLHSLLKGEPLSDLAKRIGVSRQRVHQRLNGVLWKARARADLARHLGCEPMAEIPKHRDRINTGPASMGPARMIA